MELNQEYTSLVLSGGGANGGYAVRILKRFAEDGFDFSKLKSVSGVSVGAIAGAMVTQNEVASLAVVFKNLRNNQVYNGKMNLFGLVLSIVKKRNYVLDIEPLFKLLKKYISLEKAKKGPTFYIGTTDLRTGIYHTFTQQDFDNDDDYIRCIMASCTQPIIWKPQTFTTKNGEVFENMVDGGVVTISPISPVLKDPDLIKVLIINSSPAMIEEVKTPSNIFSLVVRLIDILIGQSFSKDMQEFKDRNGLLHSYSQKNKFYNSTIFQFKKYLPSLEFEDIDLNFQRIKEADKDYNNYIGRKPIPHITDYFDAIYPDDKVRIPNDWLKKLF